jgi:protocatechuate 3,4-dioxygenase beta subunit
MKPISRYQWLPVCLLACLLSSNSFAQGTVNATVGGTVADASGALIPGVSVTATNVGTGIVNSAVTNESGAYNFASLQPGTYKISAELPGFQTQTFTDVHLGARRDARRAPLAALRNRLGFRRIKAACSS